MVKKWLAIGLKAAVSVGLIWYLLSGIDFPSLRSQLVGVNTGMVAMAAAVLALQIVFGGMRWGSVVKGLGHDMPYPTAMRLFYIGMFFNQALPGGTGGDAVRMFMARRLGASLRHAINGVLIERVATVLALVVLVDATQPLFLKSLQPEMASLSVTSVIGISLAAVIGLAVVSQLDRLPQAMQRWRLVRGMGNLGVDVRQIMFSPGRAAAPLFWSFAGHLNISLCVYFLALALRLDVSLLDCVVLVPPVQLILTVPVSIGGWGVRESAMVWAFALVGVATEAALVLSLLFGVVALLVSLPGGIVWLVTRGADDKSFAVAEGGIEALEEKHEKT